MDTTFSSQLFGFVVSIPAGAILGAFYDVLRIWRTFFHTEKRAVFFQDVFYMGAAAFFTFLLTLTVSYGEVRFYLLFGEILGWFVYYYTLGQVTAFIFRAVSGFLYRFIFYPVLRILHGLFNFFSKKIRIIVNWLKKMGGFVKNRLKQYGILVYNLSDGVLKRRKRQKGVLKHERSQKTKTQR